MGNKQFIIYNLCIYLLVYVIYCFISNAFIFYLILSTCFLIILFFNVRKFKASKIRIGLYIVSYFAYILLVFNYIKNLTYTLPYVYPFILLAGSYYILIISKFILQVKFRIHIQPFVIIIFIYLVVLTTNYFIDYIGKLIVFETSSLGNSIKYIFYCNFLFQVLHSYFITSELNKFNKI